VDWLTFVDHLIGHLAWPLAVAGLIVFLSLRHRVAMEASEVFPLAVELRRRSSA
jgi:hypothetical protein